MVVGENIKIALATRTGYDSAGDLGKIIANRIADHWPIKLGSK
jgi:hypothetical protein